MTGIIIVYLPPASLKVRNPSPLPAAGSSMQGSLSSYSYILLLHEQLALLEAVVLATKPEGEINYKVLLHVEDCLIPIAQILLT